MLSLSACESTINEVPTRNYSSGNPSAYTFTALGTHYNSDNPYDSVGIRHNEALAYTLNNVLNMFDDLDSASVIDTMKLSLLEYFTTYGSCVQSTLDSVLDEANTAYDAECETDAAQWLATVTGPGLTNKESHYINEIGKVFCMKLEDSTIILDSILAVEQRIISENWNLDYDETAALTTVSIWKHSFLFWNKVGSDVLEGGGEPQDWSPIAMAFPGTMDTRACTYGYVKNGKYYIRMTYRSPESTWWSVKSYYSKKWQQFKSWLCGDDD